MLTTNGTVTIVDFEYIICDNITFLQPSSPTAMTFEEEEFLSVVMWNCREGFWLYLHILSSVLMLIFNGITVQLWTQIIYKLQSLNQW